MVVIGYTSTHLRTAKVPEAPCPACGQAGAVRLRVFGRYAHLSGIPIFTLGKTGHLHCNYCQVVLKPRELPATHRSHWQALKNRVRTPSWHFAWFMVAATVAFGNWAHGAWQLYQGETRLAHPHVGDVYRIRSEAPGYFTLLKVVEVNGNSVRLRQNAYESNIEADFRQLNKPANYEPDPFDLTQLDLQIMQQQHELLAVERP
ncbi:hypothetical protein [Hymenobacter sp. CRA2]|uniref:hypothetical protein n=1 Tax=Hymenobacter sp. CRA2 TaxID=1955620 RepID=UPI00098F5F07|nr:hypothetical protein [Hymenobacter sp. CRA2]OON68460.1 hypothetical protein B0919_12475 [Hymenobacter sp. CRA2]